MFAVYTHKELCWLKTQVREHEKLIQNLQLGNSARDIQVRGFFSSLLLWFTGKGSVLPSALELFLM